MPRRNLCTIFCRPGLTPPTPFLSNAVKYSPGRGWGWPREGDLGPATVLSHSIWSHFPLLEGGNAVRFFSFCVFCVWFGVFCRFLPFFPSQGRCLKKFSGANFGFWVLLLVLCFSVLFCLGFCFIFWRFAPESVRKNSLDVRSAVFCVRSLFLWFFRRRRFCLFSFFLERYRSGSNRTPPHAPVFVVPVLFFCPAALLVSPFLAVRPASRRFSRGAILGPARFRILSEPSEALSLFLLDARRQGCFLSFLLCRFCFPLLWCLRLHTLF